MYKSEMVSFLRQFLMLHSLQVSVSEFTINFYFQLYNKLSELIMVTLTRVYSEHDSDESQST
jgi:hypothetical protein